MPSPVYRLATAADAYEIAVMSRYLIEVGLRGWTWPPERVAKAIRARDTNVVVADVKKHVVGFGIMDFGDTTAHLSLLAVKPTHQRCGIGRKLMALTEAAVARRGGGQLYIETSSRGVYARTRRFYRAAGYRQAARLADFYAPGDHKIIFCKNVAASAGRRAKA